MILNISGATQSYLANINNTQQQINKAEEEVSSGLSVQEPSDNPAAVSEILQTQADIATNAGRY
jgi:flagellin-like hook-associated protein FlgL